MVSATPTDSIFSANPQYFFDFGQFFLAEFLFLYELNVLTKKMCTLNNSSNNLPNVFFPQ